MVMTIAAVLLTLPYLGPERFGLWMVLASLVGLLGFLDLGIGNALVNRVAEASVSDRPDELARTVGDGLVVMLVLAMVIGLGSILIAVSAPLEDWLGVRGAAQAHELRASAKLFGCWFGVFLFSNSILRILAGLQRAYIGHIAVAIGYVVSLSALYFAAQHEASIPVLLNATLGVNALAPLPLLLVLWRRGWLRWPGLVPLARILPLLKSGSLYLLLQVGVMVGWSIDPLIISRVLGLADVSTYSVVQRLFQFVAQPLAILNAPLWAAYAEAQARGDRSFVARTLRRSLRVTAGVATAGSAVLVLVGPFAIAVWTHSALTVPLTLLLVFGAWSVVEAVGGAFAMFLNGCGITRVQVVALMLFCAVTLPAKILLASQFGVTGVVLATLACYLAVIPGMYWLTGRREISRALG